jgi:hypothetical protein
MNPLRYESGSGRFGIKFLDLDPTFISHSHVYNLQIFQLVVNYRYIRISLEKFKTEEKFTAVILHTLKNGQLLNLALFWGRFLRIRFGIKTLPTLSNNCKDLKE